MISIIRRIRAKLCHKRNRYLSRQKAKYLRVGANHYSAYIGEPKEYDWLGASQFRLLCTLGLREHYRLLDFGCGSLRAGRLLILYLNRNCYFGIEPNKWLIKAGINKEIGKDIIKIKKPVFSYNDDFICTHFNVKFDFVLAQSIFSHCGKDLIKKGLEEFSNCINDSGLCVVTFIITEKDDEECIGSGWFYPTGVNSVETAIATGCAKYKRTTINNIINEVGFHGIAIPWYRGTQTWYVLSKSQSALPQSSQFKHLSGAVLNKEQFKKSL